MLRRPWRSFLLALAFALLFAPTVVAHAELVSATPGPDDEVVGSPPELVARFSQNLDPSRTSMEVRDASGARMARGGEIGDGKREFRLALPELTPGEYEVRWTTFSSEDQELGRGSYRFTVSPAPSPAPSPTPSPSARPSSTPSIPPTASPTTPPTARPSEVPALPSSSASAIDTALPIAATALVVAIVLVWLLRRRRP